MGKYTKLRGKVEAFALETSYQEKVNAAKFDIVTGDQLENANVSKLAADFAAITRIKGSHEDTIALLNIQLEALSQLLVEALESNTIENVKLSSGALVYLQDTPYPQVDDREKLFAWIKKERLMNLLTVHHQTLKSIVSERLMSGKAAPPGVKVFLKTQARVRGANGEADE